MSTISDDWQLLPALHRVIFSSDFAIGMGIFVLLGIAVAVARRLTPEKEPDWLDILIAKCARETKHRIDRKPNGPLDATRIFPRRPGIYKEQSCMCGRKTRSRRIGSENSKAARDFQRLGK